MDADLAALLDSRAGRLGAAVAAALLAQDAPHYRQAAPDDLRARCERLAAAFVAAVRRGSAQPFESYVRGIAEQRVAEGFLLREVQLALSALEAQVWPLVVEAGGATDTVVQRLALVTGIVGRGKDELARVFMEQRQTAEARARQLARELETLFKGTDPAPQPQETP
jgi:hypothetical protein